MTTKTPAQKMREQLSKANRAPFDWESPDGVKITLPSVAMIPFGTMEDIGKLPADQQEGAMLDAVADEDTRDKIRKLPVVDVMVLLMDWQDASGINLPESGAS